MERYSDRSQAGNILAQQLKAYRATTDALILALPRGGVPVAYEIASALSIPLDLFVVRKLGVPGYEELALGALAYGGVIVYREEILNSLNLNPKVIDRVIAAEKEELTRRESVYRQGRPSLEIKDKTILLIDDGIATGASMLAALKALRALEPKSIIVAVPVAAQSTCKELASFADEFICPLQPSNLQAVGLWYETFGQTTDEEVIGLLAKANSDLAIKKSPHSK